MNHIIGGTIILLISILDCLKYLFQAAKIRKYKNSKVVSRKFHIISFVTHIVIVGILASWREWFMVAVFAIGCFTTAVTVYACWAYYPKRERGNIWHYLKNSFEGRWF